MSTQCDECRAEYSTADENTRNNPFGPRCKRCNQILSAPKRPGVAGLTAQRNENSALFSLDGLAAMVSAPTPAAVGAGAPAAEGSGLIDIRAMRGMLEHGAGSEASRAPGRPSPLGPSFGAGGLGRLSTDRLVSVVPTPKPNAGRGPLYALIAVLGLGLLGLLGLGAVVVLDEPKQALPTKEVVTVAAAQSEDPPQEQASQPSELAAEAEPEPTPEPAIEPDKHNNKRNNKRNSKRNNKRNNTASAETTSAPAKATEEINVDCLLGKDSPACKASKSNKGNASANKDQADKPTPNPDLAKKLDQSQILAGIRPIKTAAKPCGSGTTVAVKFSVKGSTGAVLSVNPLDEHSSSAVGKCVASAAKKATFPKFQAEQQGFTFKFRL